MSCSCTQLHALMHNLHCTCFLFLLLNCLLPVDDDHPITSTTVSLTTVLQWVQVLGLTKMSNIFKLITVFAIISFCEAQISKIRWCTTRCLCKDDSSTPLKCFKSEEIFLKFFEHMPPFPSDSELDNDFTWCSGYCLCHRNGLRSYKCGNDEKIIRNIRSSWPFMSEY